MQLDNTMKIIYMKILPVNQKKLHALKKNISQELLSQTIWENIQPQLVIPPKCPIILKRGKKWNLYRTSQLDNLDLNSCSAKLIAVYSLTTILKLSESCSCIK